MTMLVPALLIWLSIEARAPLPIATMTITAATPMIMPSAVSAVRIALRRSACTAIHERVPHRHGVLVPVQATTSASSSTCASSAFALVDRRGGGCATG